MEVTFYKKNIIPLRAKCLMLLLTGVCFVTTAYTQEDATNRQYLFNLLNVNPAYAGTRGLTSITTSFHKQWAGVPGSPRTGIFSIDAPISEHHLGLGLQLYDNTLGMEHTSGVNMSFATILNLADDELISMGLQAGLMNYRIDRTSVALPFQDDPAFQYNTNALMPTAGAGIYYQGPKLYAGLSAPSLLISTVKVDNIISINSPTLNNLQLLFTAGTWAQLGDDFQVKPSVFLKWMRGKVFDVHINTTVWIKDRVGIGASYRADDAILGILELKISDKLSFGYSYGSSIGDKGVFSQGSHEAIIRLNLGSNE
jgi:type IX secretion system PorP/SprF family membrane protein